MSARPEPVTLDMLIEEARAREIHVTCPLCSEPSQVLEFDRYDPMPCFEVPGLAEPRLMAFVMTCGCKVPSEAWILRVELEPRRARFEAVRR